MQSNNIQGKELLKSTQIIPTRAEEVDLIKGAHDTSSIDASQNYINDVERGNEFADLSPDTANLSSRQEEKDTIHNLIENSENHDHHAADPSTGKGTHHNEHRRHGE